MVLARVGLGGVTTPEEFRSDLKSEYIRIVALLADVPERQVSIVSAASSPVVVDTAVVFPWNDTTAIKAFEDLLNSGKFGQSSFNELGKVQGVSNAR